MTLSKDAPSGGEAHRQGGSNAKVADEEHSSSAATPYKGSRCCVGFFQCQVCSHEWSSVFSWANTGQLCKPCSSKRRQTWVLPFRQIPKSRKYEFFCIDCDKYIAESFRNRDAHSGIACESCQALVFPDWEFPCDECNVVHLYSFSKTDAMRGIDCECGAFLFPKHMKSLNRKHESQFCQKCQELGVNCCNFKATPDAENNEAEIDVQTAQNNSSTAKKSFKKKSGRPRKGQRSSVSSEVDATAVSGSEGKSSAPSKNKSAPRRKPRTSVSSVEGEAQQQQGVDKQSSGGRKPGQRSSEVSGGQRRKPRVSFSDVEGDDAEKKPARRRPAPKQQKQRVSEGEGDISGDEKTTTAANRGPRRRRPAPRGRKASGGEQGENGEGEEVIMETANRVAKSASRGAGVGRGAARGGRGGGAGNKQRVHVYGEDDVLRHARTPKNSVAVDPGIREHPFKDGAKKPARQRQQKRSRTDRGGGGAVVGKGGPVGEAEVDALADQVAESVILSAKRVIVEENNNEIVIEDDKAPRQQKDENDNSIILEKKGGIEAAAATAEEAAVVEGTAVVSSSSSPSKSKAAVAAADSAEVVELKGGHPPAIKIGGRRRVSSGRKSESEGKKVDIQSAQPEEGADVEAVAKEAEEADPENSQVQVVAKSKSVNYSEMTSVPEKPSPTKEVNRMPKVHAHHPTNKHPIQQPKKC